MYRCLGEKFLDTVPNRIHNNIVTRLELEGDIVSITDRRLARFLFKNMTIQSWNM